MYRPWDGPDAWTRSPAFGPLPLLGFPTRGAAFRPDESENDFYAYTVVIPTLAPGVGQTVNLNIEQDSDFECIAFTGAILQAGQTVYTFPSNAPQMLVSIMDGRSGRNLFGGNTLNNFGMTSLCNICGDGPFPHVLPVSRKFMRSSVVSFNFFNIDSAITMSGFFTMVGRKITHTGRDESLSQMGQANQFRVWRGQDGGLWQEDYFAYNFTVATLAAGNSITLPITMDAYSDFEWITSTICMPPRNTTTGTTATSTNSLLTAQISDGTTERRLFTGATPILNLFGFGRQPFQMPQTRVFPSDRLVRLTLSNVDTVPYNNIVATIEGRKIFGLG